MVLTIIFICFILILIILALICRFMNYYNSLTKSTWADSPLIYTFLLGLSLTFLTLGVFINIKENIPTIPLYFMIIFFEFIWLITFYLRMYSISTLITTTIFILTGFEIMYIKNSKNPELVWLISPFLFFSLIQLAITDDISKYNIGYDDII
jgi:hypothetical protein